MTVTQWVLLAPSDVRSELQSVPVMNALREHRNNLFQSPGAYDGAMSEECKSLIRTGYAAINELIAALQSNAPSP
jgi:hypothetical protein